MIRIHEDSFPKAAIWAYKERKKKYSYCKKKFKCLKKKLTQVLIHTIVNLFNMFIIRCGPNKINVERRETWQKLVLVVFLVWVYFFVPNTFNKIITKL